MSKLIATSINLETVSFPRDNNFDLIRLLASIQVLLWHGNEHFNLSGNNVFWDVFIHRFLRFFPGVPIFFVLSGFLIFSSFVRNPNFVSYIRNRFLRLFPGLYVALVLTISLLVYSGYLDYPIFITKSFLLWLFGQLTIFQFYTPSVLRGYGLGNPNGSLWTIVVELQFYFFVPLFVLSVSYFKNYKRVLIWLLLFFLTVNIGSSFLVNHDVLAVKMYKVTILPYLFYFLLGGSLYVFFNDIKHFFKMNWKLILIIYIGYYSLFSIWLDLYSPSYFSNFFGVIGVLILIWLMFSFSFSNLGLAKKVLKGNDISYGLYIYHGIVLNFMIEREVNGGFTTLAYYGVLSLLLGWLSWRFIEKPALKYKFK